MSIGPWLQAHRQALGVSVADLARVLKLQTNYIEALEAEAFDRLPARPYAVGYVRSMAGALGLDPGGAAARLHAAWSAEAAGAGEPPVAFADGPRERRFPASAVLSLTILVAIAAYAYWYATKSAEMGRPLLSPVAELEASAPPEQPPPVPAPGPLQLLGVPDLAQSADAVAAFGRGQAPAAMTAKRRLPAMPVPRPRPGTEAAALFAAAYEWPIPDAGSDTNSGPRQAGGGATSHGGPEIDRLPPTATLAAYLPAVRLRGDLGPLRAGTQSPLALQTARKASGTVEDVALALPIGRTQAFAAVPPAAVAPASRREANVGKAGGYAAMTALSRAADPDHLAIPAIAILADQQCWIEVRTRAGKVVVQRLLQPGERLDVPGRYGLTLTAGNAGGIRVLVDGVTAPAFGGVGQVVRGVSLAPHDLLAHR